MENHLSVEQATVLCAGNVVATRPLLDLGVATRTRLGVHLFPKPKTAQHYLNQSTLRKGETVPNVKLIALDFPKAERLARFASMVLHHEHR